MSETERAAILAALRRFLALIEATPANGPACPACGADAPASARYCDMCGAQIGGDHAAAD